MVSRTKERYRKKPAAPDRCVHCGGELNSAPLTMWQQLNRAYPLPGVFSMLYEIEREYGDCIVFVCVECFCFIPAGTEKSHSH